MKGSRKWFYTSEREILAFSISYQTQIQQNEAWNILSTGHGQRRMSFLILRIY